MTWFFLALAFDRMIPYANRPCRPLASDVHIVRADGGAVRVVDLYDCPALDGGRETMVEVKR